jgi:hypothetical protein
MAKINDEILIRFLKKSNMTQKEMAAHFGCSEPAITKRKKRYKKLGLYNDFELPGAFMNLTEKEQKFVLARVEGKTQTDSVREAYDCSTDGSARSLGSQLMTRNDIQESIGQIMQWEGLTRTKRVRVLKKHIYSKDPNVSLKGLDQSWKLEGLYLDKHIHAHVHFDYNAALKKVSELDEEIKQLEAELGIVDV